MKPDDLIAQLSSSNSFDEKSGLLADAIISKMDSPTANTALMCGLIYWFNHSVISKYINDDSLVDDATKAILALPFVELHGNGFSFHNSTRAGLLLLYKKQPEQIINAYLSALPELLNNWEDDDAAATAVYGLIATSDPNTEEKLLSITKRFTDKHQLNKLKLFIKGMKEVFWLLDKNILSDKGWSQISWLQFIDGKVNDAVSSCNQALQIHPKSENLLLLRSTINKVRGKFDISLSDLNKVVSINSKSVNAYLGRADLHLLENEYSHASMDYYKALELDPKSSMAYMGLARIFKEKGNKAKQLALYKKAIESDPNNIWVYLERGSAYLEANEFEKALDDFNKIIEISPLDEIALIGRSAVYQSSKRYDLALLDLQKVLNINSENVLALHKKGQIYYKEGKYNDAIVAFEKVLSINAEYSLVHEDLWKTCTKVNDIEGARRYFLNAINISTQQPNYYMPLIFSARHLRQFDLGVLAAKKALEMDSDLDATYNNALGYLYTQIGELNLAEEHLQKALSITGVSYHSEYIFINLGVVKWLEESKIEALEYFRKAVDRILKQKRELNKFDGNKKRTTAKKALNQDINKDSYVLGWTAIMTGNSDLGISQIVSYIEKYPDEQLALLDLRDWITAVKKSSDIPSGINELQDIVEKEISTWD